MVTELVPAAGLPGKTRSSVDVSNEVSPGNIWRDLGKGSWDQFGKSTYGMFSNVVPGLTATRSQREESTRWPGPPCPSQASDVELPGRPQTCRGAARERQASLTQGQGPRAPNGHAHQAGSSPGANGVGSSFHSESSSQTL